jgi:predicted RNA-binding Zn-ribbon protein involved in translation (DUF1610 family)
MPIEFACPNGHVLKAPEERAGKTGKCPKCGVAFLVPNLEDPVEDFAAADAPPAEAPPPGSSPSGAPTAGDAAADADSAATASGMSADAAPREETIAFLCPNGHKLTSPARLQGKAGKCPHCGEKFRVPSLDETDEDIGEFGVEDEIPAFGAEDQYADQPGMFPDEFDAAADEIPQDAMVEEEFGPPHPMRLLFERLWREHEHGGKIRLHLSNAVTLEADFYARSYSRGGYGVIASRDEKGNYRIAAIQWDAVERIEVDELVNLPDGVFE